MASPIKLTSHRGPSWTRSSLTGSRSLTGVPTGSLPRDPPLPPPQGNLERSTSLYNPHMNNGRVLEDKRARDEVLHLEKIVEFLKYVKSNECTSLFQNVISLHVVL